MFKVPASVRIYVYIKRLQFVANPSHQIQEEKTNEDYEDTPLIIINVRVSLVNDRVN